MIECMTYRWGGSTVRDPDLLRPAAEKAAARDNCPLGRFKSKLVAHGMLIDSDYEELVQRTRQRIDAAELHAKTLPFLTPEKDMLSRYRAYAEDQIR